MLLSATTPSKWWIHLQIATYTASGAADPQGVVYVGEMNKLFVANGSDGMLRIYDGASLDLLNTVDIGEDADNVRYDPAEKRIYVAYGGDEVGGIAVIDAATGKRLEDVAKLDAHLESFQIAASKPLIYANIATKAKVVVIDRTTHKVTDWPLICGEASLCPQDSAHGLVADRELTYYGKYPSREICQDNHEVCGCL